MSKTKLKNDTKPKTIVGIDYSLTSPAVCINNDGEYMFYYLTNKKKYIGQMAKNIIGYEHQEYDTPIKRFSQISDWAINTFNRLSYDLKNLKVFIEGYSFGSKGQAVFQIAENCGILKYRLQQLNINYDTVVPSVVKKGATGKGNADKDMMYESFVKETKIDLKKIFDTEKVGNPVSDIADSYFIQKVGYENSSSNIIK
jgi:Holliday junction resolvasome RuvABC endonuclease subunit